MSVLSCDAPETLVNPVLIQETSDLIISETPLSQKRGWCQKATIAIVGSTPDLRGVSQKARSLWLVLHKPFASQKRIALGPKTKLC